MGRASLAHRVQLTPIQTLNPATPHGRVRILLGHQDQEPGLALLSPQIPQMRQGSSRQEQQLQEHFSVATCEQVDLSSCPIQGLKRLGWPPQGTLSWLSLPYVLQPMTLGPVPNCAQPCPSPLQHFCLRDFLDQGKQAASIMLCKWAENVLCGFVQKRQRRFDLGCLISAESVPRLLLASAKPGGGEEGALWVPGCFDGRKVASPHCSFHSGSLDFFFSFAHR